MSLMKNNLCNIVAMDKDDTVSTLSGPKYWHPQQEQILKGWGESAACYRYLHYKSYTMYKKMSLRFTIPIIVIGTITGTANFAQESFPEGARGYVPAGIGAMNLFGAILTTIQQFLKVNELMESHRVSYIHYGKLARSIRLELALPISERQNDGTSMVNMCRTEYDRLIEQSPPVPNHIIESFEKRFPDPSTIRGCKGNVPRFNRPEIMTIKPIEPYQWDKDKNIIRSVIDNFRNRASPRHAVVAEEEEDIELANTLLELRTPPANLAAADVHISVEESVNLDNEVQN